MRKRAGISDQQVDELYGPDPHPKGPENWRWVHAVVRAIDKYGFGMSDKAIEAIMRDVYLYISRGGVRNQIDRIVKTFLTEEPTIVVGHSLGSVVAYNVLRTDTQKFPDGSLRCKRLGLGHYESTVSPGRTVRGFAAATARRSRTPSNGSSRSPTI
jgi:pimeloyl-ACP methyl ester carboxylesterase